MLTIDGSTGQVLAGKVPMREPELAGEFATLMQWADAARKLKVRANADTPADARAAIKFGAEGIGLCRTEHMFFEEDRIRAVREMILAEDEKARRAALAKLLPMQRADFVELFKIMGGLPVTIRLLDPPLHEFLPHTEEEIAEVASAMGADPKKLADRARELHEFNPMLGFRGCRLAIAYPEIAEMQARAIFEAAVEVGRATGTTVAPEIMVPLIASKAELDIVKERIDAMAQTVAAETNSAVKYQVGTMIELPRAALKAGEIAETAEFFSFGTNDLTQTAFGISRDDAASFLGIYTAKGILAADPFVSIDREGVGELVRIAAERGRKVRPKLKLGICGEHGGDPASVAFCHEVGLDYVSCSPFRVPIARLAAAQAALGKRIEFGRVSAFISAPATRGRMKNQAATPARKDSMCRRRSATADSTDCDVSSTTSADICVCVAAPATSLSTSAMLWVACAALATFDEMLLVAALCSSIEAATPVA